MMGKTVLYHGFRLLMLARLLLIGQAGWAMNHPEPPAVEGVAAIVQNNQATAREQAVRDGLRKALEQEVTTLLGPLTLPAYLQNLETRLYTRTLNFIRSYRVVWEYPDVSQKVYRVGIEADIAVDAVAQEIQALGLATPGAEHSRLLILVAEDHVGRTHMSAFGRGSGVVARVLRTQLQAQGFRPVSLEEGAPWDGHEESALTMGKKAGAGVVLIGQAHAEKVRSDVAGLQLQAVEAVVQVQAFTIATGTRLALERAEATALHADAILGGTQALENAAAAIAARLTLPLRTFQQQAQQPAGAPRSVQ
jgi:hypothetical protein